MPGDDGHARPLDALLDDLLEDRPADPADVLTRVSRTLTPRNRSLARARIATRLKSVPSFSAEAAVRAACFMHLSGVPAHQLVHFLAASLPGSLTLSQFELAVRFIFDDDPPLPHQLLYDLTQYTYLEKKLLAQRSVELASLLQGSLSPPLLLYLYLLSLRDDLSNENAHLILLILRICFPALKVRGRPRGISAVEEREIAEAWKNAQKSARYAQLSPPVPRAVLPEERLPRESASYFLDKYFSDRGEEEAATGPADREPLSAGRFLFTGSSARGGTPRVPRPGARVSGRKAGARARRKKAPQTVLPTPASHVPRVTEASGSAPPPRAAPPRRVIPRVTADGTAFALAPFILAAAISAAIVGVRFRIVEIPEAKQSGTPPSATQTPAGPQPVLAPPSHVVRQGDTLWKIYRSLRNEGTVDSQWKDFLRQMKERNGLQDPDRIFPGNVLSITTEGK